MRRLKPSPASLPKSQGGRGARAAGPEPNDGPLLSRYGDRIEFSASPPVLRATGSRKPTGAGFWWRPAGLSAIPDPDLVAAFSPVRRKPATGGRLPGPPDPGVSYSPGQSAAPTPAIFHKQQGSSRARVRVAITGRRFPLDRTPPHVDGPGARRPPPRRDAGIMRPVAGRLMIQFETLSGR